MTPTQERIYRIIKERLGVLHYEGEVQILANKIDALIEKEVGKREKKHKSIYRWLLGHTDFPERLIGEGQYYWRTRLRERLKRSLNLDVK